MKQSSHFTTFARYAALNVLGMIGLSCYILADTFFIANGIGADGLTALNLAIPVYSIINGLGLMLGMGGATKYTIYCANPGGREEAAGHAIFTHTLLLGGIIAAVFVASGLGGAQTIARLMGADARVLGMTQTYIQVILLFSPAFLLNNILICYTRNDERPKLAMAAMLLGSLANIIMDYILIFPCQMGIFGAVLATGMAPIVSIGGLSVHLVSKRRGFRCRVVRPKWRYIKPHITLGFPSFVLEVASGIVIIVFNAILLQQVGNIGVAAYGIVANISLVVLAIFTGIAQGMQPVVSRVYGQGERKAVRQVLRYGLITTTAVAVILYLAIFFGAEPIAAAFNKEANWQLQQMAVQGLVIYFLGAPFAGLNIVYAMFFAATERAIPAHTISIARGLLVIVPAAFALAEVAGLTGVWLAFPVTEMLVLLIGLAMSRSVKKKS